MNHPPLRRPLLQSRRAQAALAAIGTALTLAAPVSALADTPVSAPADTAVPATTTTPPLGERLLVVGVVGADPAQVLGLQRQRRPVPVAGGPRVDVGEPPSAR